MSNIKLEKLSKLKENNLSLNSIKINLYILALTSNSITIGWKYNEKNINNLKKNELLPNCYILQISEKSNKDNDFKTLMKGNCNKLLIKDLLPRTKYYFRVKAINIDYNIIGNYPNQLQSYDIPDNHIKIAYYDYENKPFLYEKLVNINNKFFKCSIKKNYFFLLYCL